VETRQILFISLLFRPVTAPAAIDHPVKLAAVEEVSPIASLFYEY
jgi:hypothetical protein